MHVHVGAFFEEGLFSELLFFDNAIYQNLKKMDIIDIIFHHNIHKNDSNAWSQSDKTDFGNGYAIAVIFTIGTDKIWGKLFSMLTEYW